MGYAERELLYQRRGVAGVLFGEEVAAFHRLPLRTRSPLPPNPKRPAVLRVESVERPALGPEVQHRAFDPFRSFLVGTIVFDVNGCRGPIFLADSVNAGGIAVSGNVLRENLRPERTLPEWVMEHRFGSAEEITLRKGLLLRQ